MGLLFASIGYLFGAVLSITALGELWRAPNNAAFVAQGAWMVSFLTGPIVLLMQLLSRVATVRVPQVDTASTIWFGILFLLMLLAVCLLLGSAVSVVIVFVLGPPIFLSFCGYVFGLHHLKRKAQMSEIPKMASQ
jgi:hypothetical protein